MVIFVFQMTYTLISFIEVSLLIKQSIYLSNYFQKSQYRSLINKL